MPPAVRVLQDYLGEQHESIGLSSSLYALSIVRFLAERLPKLPLALCTRLIDDFDILMVSDAETRHYGMLRPGWLRGAVQVLCPLLEKKPWQHTDSAGGMHRFEQGQWVRVGADHQRSMAKCEAQAWLAVYALVGEPEVRRKSRGTPS